MGRRDDSLWVGRETYDGSQACTMKERTLTG